MANPGGTITRKDLIDDDALNYGSELVKKILPAIEAQEKLVESAKGYSAVISSMKKAESQQSFLEEKQKEKILYEQTANAIKAEQLALKEAEKVKQEAVKTRKLELDVLAKEERAKNGTIKLSIEERVQNEANNKVVRQQVREQLGLVGAYEKMNKARTDAKNKLRDLIATEGASTAEIKKAQKEFDVLAQKVKKADDATDDFTKNVGNYPTIGKLGGSVRELFSAFGLAAGVGAAVSVLKGAYNTIVLFDQGIADLGAITGASGKDLEYLKTQAIDLGKETKGGAVKVVEAYKLIASAKPELLENVENLNQVTKAVLTLSKASGLELPEAATALTDAMNQFGAPAEEAGIFIDALANGAKYGAAEIPQVTEALLKFGAVARSSNISIQESTALIELLAENGIKGAEAGTALRNVLLKISAPDALPKEAQKALKDLGVSFELLKDKAVPIQEKFEALKPLLADNGKLLKAFGFENTVAARNIIEHTDRLAELTGKMNEYGTAQEQATQRSNTLQGKTERLSASYDSFILGLNNGKGVISSFFSFFIDGAADALIGLDRLNSSWDELNAKARASGKEMGVASFQQQFQGLKETGSVEDVSDSIIKVARKNYIIVQKKIDEQASYINSLEKEYENSKFIANKAIYGIRLRNAKADFEDLLKERAKEGSVIDQGKKKKLDANRLEIQIAKDKSETLAGISKEDDKDLEKAQKEAEKARKDYLARMKQVDDDSFALLKFRKEQEIKISDEIAANDKELINDRVDALLNGNKIEDSLAEETAKYKLRQLSQYNDEVRDLTNKEIDNLINGLEIKKTLTNAEKLVLEEFSAKKRDIKLKEKEETQRIIDAIVDQEKKKVDSLIQVQEDELNRLITNENIVFKEKLEAAKGNNSEIERLTLEHEENILKIKKDFAKQGLQTQIDAIEEFLRKQDSIPEKDKISAEKRKQIESDLINAKKLLSEEDLKNTDLTTEKKIEIEKEYASKIKEASIQLKDELVNLTNVIFDAKVSKIDAEIQKNDEYYSEQIRLAGDDQRQKDLLTAESERKRKELEKEKRKEQVKQAIFNKATAALQIGISTAQAIMAIASTGGGTFYADFGVSAGILTAITAGIGAAQLAAVLAAPLPKYELGTDWHIGGKAVVGEKRPEVIIEPGKNPYVVSSPQILDLAKGTKVIPSLEQYEKEFGKDNIDAMLKNSKGKIDNYNNLIQLNFHSKEMIEEMRLTRKAIERNKPQRPINPKNVDIPHSIWAFRNTKWS